MFTARLKTFIDMQMTNKQQIPLPPLMRRIKVDKPNLTGSESDEDGELVHAFNDSDVDNSDIDGDDSGVEWDGIIRCSSCKNELSADKVNEEYCYHVCTVCYNVLDEYVKLGIDYLQQDKTHTATFSRDCILTVEGPTKRGLEKALTKLYTYLQIADCNVVQFESGASKYEICLEYDMSMISKPRLKPYRCRERILIERKDNSEQMQEQD